MLHWAVYFILVSIVFVKLGTINVLGFTLNQVVIVVGLFLGLVSKLFSKKDVYRFSTIDLSLVIFGAYLWISNFIISDNPAWGMRVCMDYLRSLACYFTVVFLITDAKKIRLLVLTYILASTAMILTTNPFENVNTGMKFVSDARQGLTGLAGSYIIYALYALMSVPLAFAMFKSIKNRFRFIFFIIIVLLSMATLFSGSRGAVISFVVTMIGITVIEALGNKESVVRSVMFLTAMSIGIIVIYWIKGGESILGTLVVGEGQRLDSSLAGRVTFLKEALSQFLNHPVFGIGVDASRYGIFKHVPHNQWLQILVELGLFGFVLSAFITYAIFRALLSAKKIASRINDLKMVNIINGVMISIFTLLFWGLYENIGYIAAQKTLFMLIGLAVSINTYVVKKWGSERPDRFPETYPLPTRAGSL